MNCNASEADVADVSLRVMPVIRRLRNPVGTVNVIVPVLDGVCVWIGTKFDPPPPLLLPLPPVAACHEGADPAPVEVRTYAVVPAASRVGAPDAPPMIRSPVVVIGF